MHVHTYLDPTDRERVSQYWLSTEGENPMGGNYFVPNNPVRGGPTAGVRLKGKDKKTASASEPSVGSGSAGPSRQESRSRSRHDVGGDSTPLVRDVDSIVERFVKRVTKKIKKALKEGVKDLIADLGCRTSRDVIHTSDVPEERRRHSVDVPEERRRDSVDVPEMSRRSMEHSETSRRSMGRSESGVRFICIFNLCF